MPGQSLQASGTYVTLEPGCARDTTLSKSRMITLSSQTEEGLSTTRNVFSFAKEGVSVKPTGSLFSGR